MSQPQVWLGFEIIFQVLSGGIIALSLTQAANTTTPSDCINFYWQLKEKIFMRAGLLSQALRLEKVMRRLPNHTSKQTRALKKELINHFGEEHFTPCYDENSEELLSFVPRIAVTALDVTNGDRPRLEMFRNYAIPNAKGKEDQFTAKNIKLHDIAQATSAAPTYFEAVDIEDKTYIDGGLSANCPLNALFSDIMDLYPEPNQRKKKIGGILSIGTGSNGLNMKRDCTKNKRF